MVSGDESRRLEVEQAFENAEGLFKRALASGLKARVVPSLKFYYDDTLDVSEGVLKLLERVK